MEKVLTKEELQEAVENSYSIAGVLRYQGKNDKSSGQHTSIKRRIAEYGIDTSHFTGQKWWLSKGENNTPIYTTDKMFASGSTKKRQVVRKQVIRYNLIPYKCAFCGNTGEWLGKPMALELDHINGVFNDHRQENLRFLCPNCHATTDTYCGKNKRRHKDEDRNQESNHE